LYSKTPELRGTTRAEALLKIKNTEEEFDVERIAVREKILSLRGDNESSVLQLRKRMEELERGYEQALGKPRAEGSELREHGTALNEVLRAKDEEIERLSRFETF
jgi:hypothetical protein